MKCVIFFVVLAAASAQFVDQYGRYSTPGPLSVRVSGEAGAKTIGYINEIYPDGSFVYKYDTDNGIAAEAQAYISSPHCIPNVVMTRSLPVVDALIRSLEREQWKSHDGACLRATLDMLDGVNNNTLWATWVWDSIQLPMGSLYGTQAYMGNYEQCLQAVWSADLRHPGLRSQYCLVELRSPLVEEFRVFGPFDDTGEYYRTPTKDSRYFNLHYMGICLPSICSPSSVASISQHLLQLTHLPSGEVSVDPQNCAAAGQVREYPTGFYVFWWIVMILLAIAIISTLFYKDNMQQSALCTMAQSFCMRRNFRSLFTAAPDELMVMHGVRFITAVHIIYTHEAFYSWISSVINALDINEYLASRMGLIMLHLEIVVDTFFAMSGLLLVRGLMAGKQRSLLHSLLKRYIRLIGPLALCVFYQTATAKYMSNGPVWRQYIRLETDYCEKYWWKSLLMANTDVSTLCYTVTWYISCDFQMAILGTFLFFLFRKNRKLGVVTFTSVAAALTIHLGLTVYWKQLDMVPFNFKALTLLRAYTDLNYTYLSSHTRAGPYLVGMIMGYIVDTYKPSEYRNFINWKWSVIITAVSLLVGFSMLAVGAIFVGRPYDALESAVVAATNRTFWGVMVCAIIGVCEYGSLKKLPSILGWAGFVPLSKLSYCSYLLHPLLLQLQKFSARTSATFSLFNLALNVCGVLVVSTLLSLLLHLILEAPLNNISNKIFTDRSKLLVQSDTKEEVGKTGNTMVSLQHEQNQDKAKSS